MRILGIETSCDETAICLIEAEGTFGETFRFEVLGNALISQTAIHAPYGGVFPNLAKREHSRNLVPLLKEVLEQSSGSIKFQVTSIKQISSAKVENIKTILEREPELFEQLEKFLDEHGRPDIDVIAVTHGPGLEPALWVGVNFARALSTVWNIPIVGVNHLEGHIAMAMMNIARGDALGNFKASPREFGLENFEFPAIALLISGGHTELDLVKKWPDFELLGETRDDAVGEAFDKVARMMGLPYPGGPHVSALAARARTHADDTQTNADKNPRPTERIQSFGRARKSLPDRQAGASSPPKSAFHLPRPMIHEPNYDFSFSGLKTAVLRLVKDRELNDREKGEIAREFENAAAEVLVAKTLRAVEEYGAQTVLVGGGVSANTHIKSELQKALSEAGVQLLIPPPEYATDNALMIALAGYFRAVHKEFADPQILKANGNLKLGNSA